MRYSVLLAGVFAAGSCSHTARHDYEPTTAAAPADDDLQPQYRFAVEPIRPVRQLRARFSPLMQTLNANLSGCQLKLESALSYGEYLARVRRAEYDFGIFEPHLVLEAEKLGYRIFARVGAKDRIAGVVVIRSGSGIRKVRDLRGKTIAFGSPDSLASTMLVRYWLRNAGIRDREVDLTFTGSQESALLDVFAKAAAAGAASRAGWREFQKTHPEAASGLELRWQTDDLSGPAIMAHRRVPAAHERQLANLLTRLSGIPGGLEALQHTGYSEFRRAESGSYDDVWEFVNAYQASVGRNVSRKP